MVKMGRQFLVDVLKKLIVNAFSPKIGSDPSLFLGVPRASREVEVATTAVLPLHNFPHEVK